MGLIFCIKNLLEVSLVTTISGSSWGAPTPLYRIYDRDIGLLAEGGTANYFKAVMNATVAATSKGFDRGIIYGMNNNGSTVLFYTGITTLLTTIVGNIVASTSTYILTSTLTPSTGPTMGIAFDSPESSVSLTEMWFTQDVTFSDPMLPVGPIDKTWNVENLQTSGGLDRFLVHGPGKRQRNYAWHDLESSAADIMMQINELWAGSKPFFMFDHTSVWIFGKLAAPINLTINQNKLYDCQFSFIEVLP